MTILEIDHTSAVRVLAVLVGLSFTSATNLAADLRDREKLIPTIEPYLANSPPKIDGLLEEACWKDAVPIRKFWYLDGKERYDDVAMTLVCYDQSNLYLAYRMRMNDFDDMPGGSTVRDQGVWFHACCQTFVQPTPTSGYYVFTLNSRNTQEDEKDRSIFWNGHWRSAVSIAEDRSYWQAEIAIPFALFDLSGGPDNRWRMNLAVGSVHYDHFSAVRESYDLCWSPTWGNFHGAPYFGHLILKDIDWDRRQCVLTASATVAEPGKLLVSAEFQAAGSSRPGRLSVTMTGPDGAAISNSETVMLRDESDSRELSFDVSQVGAYAFTVSLHDTESNIHLAERLIGTETPPAYDAWFDRSLYTDQTQAKLTVERWLPGSPGQKCRVSLHDVNGHPLGESIVAQFDDHSQAVAILDLTDIPEGRHRVVVGPLGGQEEAATPYLTHQLTKATPRKGTVHYNERGVLFLDDEKVFPFGLYYFPIHERNFNADLFEEFVGAGLNLIVAEWTSEQGYVRIGEMLARHGVYTINSVQNGGGVRGLLERHHRTKEPNEKEQLVKQLHQRIADMVKYVADHEPTNLLAWYVADEPGPPQLPFVKPQIEITAANDPYRPTLIVPGGGLASIAFGPHTDILMPDPYPGFPGGPMLTVAGYIDAAHRAVRRRKPVLAVIQAFKDPPQTGIMPTPAELRCMTYLALVHEVAGLTYFSFNDMHLHSPAQWAAIKTLAGEVRDLAPALTETPGILAAHQTASTSQVHSRVMQVGRTAYLLAVNTARWAIDGVTWELEGFQNGSMEVWRGNRNVEIHNGRFRDRFEPLAVHVYRQEIE